MKKRSFIAGTLAILRARMLAGLLIIVPVGVTVFVALFLYNATAGLIIPLFDWALGDVPDVIGGILAILIFFIAVYLVGLFASNVIGRRIISLGEWIVGQIPVIKTIYSATKQVIESFTMSVDTIGQEVALVDFPSPGLKAIGFVTGRIRTPDGTACLKVFVPTTPNPTTGFYQMVPESTAQILALTTEEAFKLIMSAGILAPAQLELLVKSAPGVVSPESQEIRHTIHTPL